MRRFILLRSKKCPIFNVQVKKEQEINHEWNYQTTVLGPRPPSFAKATAWQADDSARRRRQPKEEENYEIREIHERGILKTIFFVCLVSALGGFVVQKKIRRFLLLRSKKCSIFNAQRAVAQIKPKLFSPERAKYSKGALCSDATGSNSTNNLCGINQLFCPFRACV